MSAASRGGAGSAAAAEEVRRRLEIVRARIEDAGGDPQAVRIVAVTKGFGADAVEAGIAAGLCDFGENYADELVLKADRLWAERDAPAESPAPRWHFVGAIQSNKIRRLAPHVHLWQTVDRVEHADALARRVPGAAVLVQVNLTGAAGRNGCAPDDARVLGERARALGLEVRGLMGVGPDPATGGGARASRAAFCRLHDLADRMGVSELSMGMSADLESAIAEGATMLRLGTALFGDRPRRPGARAAAVSSGDAPAATSLDDPSSGRS